MSGDAELLNFIYQNSQMGVDTIRQLIGVVEDKDLKEHLKTQFHVSIAAIFVIRLSVKVLDILPIHNHINNHRSAKHRSHGIQRQYVMRTRQYHQQITKQRDARTGQQRYRNQHLMIG